MPPKSPKKVKDVIEQITPQILKDLELEKATQVAAKIVDELRVKAEGPEEISINLADFTIERRAELQRVFVTKAWATVTAMLDAVIKKLQNPTELDKLSIKDLTSALKDLSSVMKDLNIKVEADFIRSLQEMSDEELERKVIELKQQSITITTEPKKEEKQVIDVKPEQEQVSK